MPETHSKRPHPVLRWIGGLGRLGHLIYPVGAVAMLSVPAALIYQSLEWWDNNRWPAISAAQALDWYEMTAPQFETAWIQQASQQFLDSPLSLALFVAIGGSLYLYALFSKWLAYLCGPPTARLDDGLL
jgi:hypothetical protein